MDIRVGILGLGGIARKMAYTVNKTEGAVLYAVGSRDTEKARSFAKDFGAAKAFGSYEELAADPDVQLIYIATPHAFHAENALLCLEHGKHVPRTDREARCRQQKAGRAGIFQSKRKDAFCGRGHVVKVSAYSKDFGRDYKKRSHRRGNLCHRQHRRRYDQCSPPCASRACGRRSS